MAKRLLRALFGRLLFDDRGFAGNPAAAPARTLAPSRPTTRPPTIGLGRKRPTREPCLFACNATDAFTAQPGHSEAGSSRSAGRGRPSKFCATKRCTTEPTTPKGNQ